MRALRLRAEKIGAVLQSKRSWLPNITIPRAASRKSAETKKPESVKKKLAETPRQIPNNKIQQKSETQPPANNFPDGWETEWQPALESEKNPTKQESKEKLEYKPAITKKTPRKWNTLIVVTAVIIGFPILMTVFTNWAWNQWFVPNLITVTPTNIIVSSPSQPTFTKTFSTLTFTPVSPTKTRTPALEPTATPMLTEITDDKGVQMVFVPEGDTALGADPVEACQSSANKDWCEENIKENNPARTVFVKAFYIDKYEVTNSLYKECVKARKCNAPSDTKLTSVEYYNNSHYDNYPVVWAYIDMANQYCTWRDARLPTGSEWEKAARGTDGRTYPWGNLLDDTPRANFCDIGASCWWRGTWKINDGFVLTSPVDSFSAGISPYGVYNMAGNVSEWVSDSGNFDRWANGYFMGGSWFDSDEYLKVYLKYEGGNYYGYDHGFRCARDATP